MTDRTKSRDLENDEPAGARRFSVRGVLREALDDGRFGDGRIEPRIDGTEFDAAPEPEPDRDDGPRVPAPTLDAPIDLDAPFELEAPYVPESHDDPQPDPEPEPEPAPEPGPLGAPMRVPLAPVRRAAPPKREATASEPVAIEPTPPQPGPEPEPLRPEPATPALDTAPPAAPEPVETAEALAARRAREEAEFVAGNSIGSLLIGARATLGKHDLKQVERELRIKARYLAAIEAIDLDNLPDDAYIAGYVKAYGRYLRETMPIGPEETYSKFKRELAAKRRRAEAEKLVAAGAKKAPAAATPAPTPVRGKLITGRPATPEPAAPSPDKTPTPAKAPTLDPIAAARAAALASARAGAAKPGQASGKPVDPEAARRAAGQLANRIAAARAQVKARAGKADPKARERVRRDMKNRERREADTRERRRLERRASGGGEPFGLRFGPLLTLAVAASVVGGLSYGGWELLRAAQRVSDPDAATARALRVVAQDDAAPDAADGLRPSAEAVAADGGVLATLYSGAGDGPIGAIRPEPEPETGPAAPSFDPRGREQVAALPAAPEPTAAPPETAAAAPETAASAAPETTAPTPAPAAGGPSFGVHALAESWVRVRDPSGQTVFSGVLAAGATLDLSTATLPVELRTGNAGGVAAVLDGVARGPIGADGAVLTIAVDRAGAAAMAALPAATATLGAPGAEPPVQ